MEFLAIAGGVVLSIIALILIVWAAVVATFIIVLRKASKDGAFTVEVEDHPEDEKAREKRKAAFARVTGAPIWMGSNDYRGGGR